MLCFIAGILGSIPYFCEKLFIFTFISLLLLFYVAVLERESKKRSYLPYFCYFIGLYFLLYLFLAELYPYERFGFTETQAVFIVICSCILIPLLHASVEALIMSCSRFFKSNTEFIIGFASLWCIGEWILTLGTLAFPWGNIAVSMTGFLPYLQTASIFGKYFITFITVAGCCCISIGCINRKRFIALIGVGVILFNTLIGTLLWFLPNKTEENFSVAAIQGNISSNEKWKKENSSDILNRHLEMITEAAENGAEIVILAESAIPITFRKDGVVHKRIAEITKGYGITVVTGAHYRDSDGNEYNSVIAVLPDGNLSHRYDKRHLVPFGEFIPFAETLGVLIPFVGAFNESSSVFVEGEEPIVITNENITLGPLVCFDSIFPKFAFEAVENGAEALAVVTNDSWFYDSVGIYTHLRHSQIRAIENNRYVLRAANTGISAFINNKGRILDSTEPLEFKILHGEVYSINETSLYFYIGDTILYISFLIVFIIFIKYKRSLKDRNNSVSQE